MTTVSNLEPSRKDTNMKLLFILSAILALTLAEEEKKEIEDLEAQAATVELMKEGVDLKASASSYPYIPPSQREPVWQKPQNTWSPPKPAQPQPPNYGQPPSDVQQDYYWSTGAPIHTHPPTTTTPVPVIKQEQYIGDNGDYKYEYQLGDGTHVGETGYFTDPKQTDESIVKKGWYSFVGADGRTYTVTYWADHTGFHAYGDHLPTAPPAPTTARPIYYDEQPAQSPVPQPKPTPPPYVPTQPPYVPTQPPYVPTQPPYSPPKVPAYNPPQAPAYNPPQAPAYNPPQVPAYNPPQQYYPPQQTYYPQAPQQTNYVPNYNV